MSFRILYTDSYVKRAARFIRRHPDLLPHPSLRLHRLKGPLQDLHSVSINISYRITLEFILDERTIIPVNVGKHGEIY
jgi:plasmid maintenance system killer protein